LSGALDGRHHEDIDTLGGGAERRVDNVSAQALSGGDDDLAGGDTDAQHESSSGSGDEALDARRVRFRQHRFDELEPR
jgi:hypothetical protein